VAGGEAHYISCNAHSKAGTNVLLVLSASNVTANSLFFPEKSKSLKIYKK
jgi:hypothetical protein